MTDSSRRWRVVVVLLAFAHSLVQCMSGQTASSRVDVDKRVDSLLSKMTVEEKVHSGRQPSCV